MSKNIVFHNHKVTKSMRAKLHNCKPCVIWFTGLSGSGKSSIAGQLEEVLYTKKVSTYLLDGDNVRHGLNKDLGFADSCRQENIRRAGELAKLFVDAGIIVLSAFISPFAKDRDAARGLLDEAEFIEIYIKCSLDVCEERDPKGLYRKARLGEIKNFTGIDSVYEPPEFPEVTIDSGTMSLDESVEKIMMYLRENNYLS